MPPQERLAVHPWYTWPGLVIQDDDVPDEPIKGQEALVRLALALHERGTMATGDACAILGRDDKRSVRRILNRLCDYGLARRIGSGRETRYVLDPTVGMSSVTPIDRIAMGIGRDALSFLHGTLLGESFEKAAAPGTEDSPRWAHLDRKIRHLAEPRARYDVVREELDAVLDGLLRGRILEIRYEKADGAEREYAARPLTLVVYRRAIYLLCEVDGRVLRLRVDRIRAACVGPHFDYPSDWDPDAELAPWFGIHASGQPEQVILEFSSVAAPFVEAREWHPTAELTRLPDGGVRLIMCTGGAELVRFVLEWGPHCTVFAPASLRKRVMADLEEALARYRDG